MLLNPPQITNKTHLNVLLRIKYASPLAYFCTFLKIVIMIVVNSISKYLVNTWDSPIMMFAVFLQLFSLVLRGLLTSQSLWPGDLSTQRCVKNCGFAHLSSLSKRCNFIFAKVVQRCHISKDIICAAATEKKGLNLLYVLLSNYLIWNDSALFSFFLIVANFFWC